MNNLYDLVAQLSELGDLEDSYFKSRAYKFAANILRRMSISEFEERSDFTDLEGIGEGINGKILEFKRTGIISKLQNLRSESRDYLDPYHYKVRKGFITKKISYKEATDLLYKISLDLLVPSTSLIPLGSYRRRSPRIGDLDLMVPEKLYPEILGKLSKKYEVISSGDYKSQFLIDKVNNIPLDIISFTEYDRVFQLLYLTGSKEFNIRMRAKAKSLGYCLNQTGLWDSQGNSVLIATSEEEVFEKLDMEYVKPEDR